MVGKHGPSHSATTLMRISQNCKSVSNWFKHKNERDKKVLGCRLLQVGLEPGCRNTHSTHLEMLLYFYFILFF